MQVLDVLTAYLILHYPLLKEASPERPAFKRLESCVLESRHSLADLLAWSTHLAAAQASCAMEEEEEANHKPSTDTEERRMIRHQATVIDHFIQHAKRQDERMDVIGLKQPLHEGKSSL